MQWVAISGKARQDAVKVSPFVNIQQQTEDGPYRCPCCGFLTLDERGSHEICTVCF
ncbi:CPCC family cysteine-rich protein [Streptomyces triticisoli]|uniref:CPCC family cysteine-rich protein n=1 Tax=Streptomyces triticisoli TaxID=2182797 RepID=UPI003F6982DC